MAQSAATGRSPYYFGDGTATVYGRPLRDQTEEDALAWGGGAKRLFSIQDRPPLARFWGPDVFNMDPCIVPLVEGVHKYRSPLAYAGHAQAYRSQEVYDDEVNTTGDLVFPLDFLRNFPECQVDRNLRALFVEGRLLYDRWTRKELNDELQETEWLLFIASLWHDLRRSKVAPGKFFLATGIVTEVYVGKTEIPAEELDLEDEEEGNTTSHVPTILGVKLGSLPRAVKLVGAMEELVKQPTYAMPASYLVGCVPSFFHLPAGALVPDALLAGKVTLPKYHLAEGEEGDGGYDLTQFAPPDHRMYCGLERCTFRWNLFGCLWFGLGRHWSASHNDYARIALCPLNTMQVVCRFNTKLPGRAMEYTWKEHVARRHKKQTPEVIAALVERLKRIGCTDWRGIMLWPCVVTKNTRKFSKGQVPKSYGPPTGLEVIAREPYDNHTSAPTVNLQDGVCAHLSVADWNQTINFPFADVVAEMEVHHADPSAVMPCVAAATPRRSRRSAAPSQTIVVQPMDTTEGEDVKPDVANLVPVVRSGRAEVIDLISDSDDDEKEPPTKKPALSLRKEPALWGAPSTSVVHREGSLDPTVPGFGTGGASIAFQADLEGPEPDGMGCDEQLRQAALASMPSTPIQVNVQRLQMAEKLLAMAAEMRGPPTPARGQPLVIQPSTRGRQPSGASPAITRSRQASNSAVVTAPTGKPSTAAKRRRASIQKGKHIVLGMIKKTLGEEALEQVSAAVTEEEAELEAPYVPITRESSETTSMEGDWGQEMVAPTVFKTTFRGPFTAPEHKMVASQVSEESIPSLASDVAAEAVAAAAQVTVIPAVVTEEVAGVIYATEESMQAEGERAPEPPRPPQPEGGVDLRGEINRRKAERASGETTTSSSEDVRRKVNVSVSFQGKEGPQEIKSFKQVIAERDEKDRERGKRPHPRNQRSDSPPAREQAAQAQPDRRERRDSGRDREDRRPEGRETRSARQQREARAGWEHQERLRDDPSRRGRSSDRPSGQSPLHRRKPHTGLPEGYRYDPAPEPREPLPPKLKSVVVKPGAQEQPRLHMKDIVEDSKIYRWEKWPDAAYKQESSKATPEEKAHLDEVEDLHRLQNHLVRRGVSPPSKGLLPEEAAGTPALGTMPSSLDDLRPTLARLKKLTSNEKKMTTQEFLEWRMGNRTPRPGSAADMLVGWEARELYGRRDGSERERAYVAAREAYKAQLTEGANLLENIQNQQYGVNADHQKHLGLLTDAQLAHEQVVQEHRDLHNERTELNTERATFNERVTLHNQREARYQKKLCGTPDSSLVHLQEYKEVVDRHEGLRQQNAQLKALLLVQAQLLKFYNQWHERNENANETSAQARALEVGIDRLHPDLTAAVGALDEPTREAVRVTEDTSERVLHLFDAHGQSRPPQNQIDQWFREGRQERERLRNQGELPPGHRPLMAGTVGPGNRFYILPGPDEEAVPPAAVAAQQAAIQAEEAAEDALLAIVPAEGEEEFAPDYEEEEDEDDLLNLNEDDEFME